MPLFRFFELLVRRKTWVLAKRGDRPFDGFLPQQLGEREIDYFRFGFQTVFRHDLFYFERVNMKCHLHAIQIRLRSMDVNGRNARPGIRHAHLTEIIRRLRLLRAGIRAGCYEHLRFTVDVPA